MTQNAMANDANALQPGALLAGVPGDGSIVEYFESRHEKPSARIYTNLASDPVVSALLRRKQPTYRELVLVVSTVVGALDSRIEELEKDARPWERLANTLNAPLLSVEPKERDNKDKKDEDSDSEGNSDPREAKWVLKYLTLRNLGGALITVLSLATGFFAFLNEDYRSLLDVQDRRVNELTEEVGVKNKEVQDTKEELQAQDIKFKEQERRILASDQQVAALQRRVKELESKRDEAVAQGAAGQVELAKELANARVRTGELEADLQATKAALGTARVNFQTEAANASSRSRTVDSLQTKLETTQTQLNGAVNSWNNLLEFINLRREGSRIEIKTADLKDHLSTLRRYTGEVEGMLKKLP